MKRTKEKDGKEMAGTVQRGGWSAVAPLSLRMHEHVRIPASMQNRLRCPRACQRYSASSFSPTAGRCTVKNSSEFPSLNSTDHLAIDRNRSKMGNGVTPDGSMRIENTFVSFRSILEWWIEAGEEARRGAKHLLSRPL